MSDLNPELRQGVAELVGNLERALVVAKKATDENTRLESELARKDQIILEKVAAAKPTATPEKVAALVTSLVKQGFANPAMAEDLTKHLVAHPDNLIELSTKLASLSLPAHSQGRGIAKEASSRNDTNSDSDWAVVIREGAN